MPRGGPWTGCPPWTGTSCGSASTSCSGPTTCRTASRSARPCCSPATCPPMPRPRSSTACWPASPNSSPPCSSDPPSGLGEADAQAEAVQDPDEPERRKERACDHAADGEGGGEQQEHLDRLGGHQHGQAHCGHEEDAGPQPGRALEEPVQP